MIRKFLVVNASAFSPSITEGFCELFEKSCPSEVIINRLNLFEKSPSICDGTYNRPEKLDIFHSMVLDCDGLFIATPCHWFNVPGVLKNFIDHLTRIEHDLWEKDRLLCVAVHSPEGGEVGALGAIILPLNLMGFTIPAFGYAYYGGGDKWAYDEIPQMPKRMLDYL